MKKALALALILGFLFVDFLFFHDVFKPGEIVTYFCRIHPFMRGAFQVVK